MRLHELEKIIEGLNEGRKPKKPYKVPDDFKASFEKDAEADKQQSNNDGEQEKKETAPVTITDYLRKKLTEKYKFTPTAKDKKGRVDMERDSEHVNEDGRNKSYPCRWHIIIEPEYVNKVAVLTIYLEYQVYTLKKHSTVFFGKQKPMVVGKLEDRNLMQLALEAVRNTVVRLKADAQKEVDDFEGKRTSDQANEQTEEIGTEEIIRKYRIHDLDINF